MSQRRRESHTFSSVPSLERSRSVFDRSHGYKTTLNEGWLVPFFVDEVAPGDSHKLRANLFCRFSTLLKPIMDNVYLETFFFFVPFRLVWDNWRRMWGEQDKPTDSTDYLVPIIDGTGGQAAVGSLWDYLGVPTGVPNLYMSALYPRAYNLIWNEWFRDENLQDSVPVPTGDTDAPTNYTLLKRGKRHDYFTSCLPWPQKGPEVILPMSGTLPVEPMVSGDPGWVDGVPRFLASNGNMAIEADGSTLRYGPGGQAPGTHLAWNDAQLKVDLGATGIDATINDFRQAVVIQQFYEQVARGGTRYTELLRAIYGVTNGDARLQRPEFLGGGRTPIMVNPVVNTTGVTGGNQQGDLAAYGVGNGSDGSHSFSGSFTEHGVIMGLLSIRADLNYQQGMPRQYTRRTKFDFLIPHFALLGEQAVLNREIYAQGQAALNAQGTPIDDDVFGYVSRYDDYRFKPSVITGEFRSTAANSVDFWHLGQEFASLPTLSPTFIQEAPPIDRVVAVPTSPHFLLDAWIGLQSVRELPVYSVPGLRRI